MTEKVKVLAYPIGKAPFVKEIVGLDDMQQIVGGMIQYVDLGAISGIAELGGYDLFCNDEGKILGLGLNAIFPNDFMVGQFFISKADKEGESISLTKEDIEKIMHHMEFNSNIVLAYDVEKIKNNRK